MTSAMIDVTIAPKTAGAAPNTPATGSQVLDVRNDSPNCRSAGHPARATSNAMSPRSKGTHDANAVMKARYTRSPMTAPSIDIGAKPRSACSSKLSRAPGPLTAYYSPAANRRVGGADPQARQEVARSRGEEPSAALLCTPSVGNQRASSLLQDLDDADTPTA